MNISYLDVVSDDIEELVNIRIAAMRESLERIGRFDPQRVRERFVASFNPSKTKFILANGVKAGFVVVNQDDQEMQLDHLYITPNFQGKNIGSVVLNSLFVKADEKNLPVKVGALKESDSNRFYQRHGFVKIIESEWDIYYVRKPLTKF